MLFQGNSREPVQLIPRPELGPTHAYLRSGDHFYTVEVNLNAPDLAPYRADVAGNVREWTQDRFGGYPTDEVINPTGPVWGFDRVIRGGGWLSAPQVVRSSYRESLFQYARYENVGFRLVRTARSRH